ncbi:hypothetical protein B0A50_00954 [Salinomyces thailandicus]|uniref:Uncharacterized protein n=1 Tax=Salinomyces thailandicus TaxID=706561 RepID=A0A4V5N5P7_9PEZI|nr:hypothetical protein B0A50_00954 [Salinomyces thailandica]
MLPPAETTLLAANPKFEALHRDLCSNKLNDNGTSRLDAKAVKEREILEEELRKARIDTVKRTLVQSGLNDLAYRGEELPEELRDLVSLAAAALNGDVAEEDRDVVADELDAFEAHAPVIASALSKQLQQDVTTIACLASPSNPPPTNELASHVQGLQNSVAAFRAQLAKSRITLTQELPKVHELYRQVIETSIRILEQTIHGSVARGTKTKADYLAVVAEGMAKKLAVQHAQLMQQVYTPEVRNDLKAKASRLDAEGVTLKRRIRDAEEKLAEYRQARGMKQMIAEYAELLREIEKVESEISRVEKGQR